MDFEEKKQISIREQRIRKITNFYYSKPEIQKNIFEFCKNREICPKYFEGFGKRPDSFQYPGDIFGLAKKGATSFHGSEELWEDPLQIITGMDEIQSNNLRTGWDLLIDIDSKYIDYSKISAQIILQMLNFHGIKNIGVKFSVSGDTPILVENIDKEISLTPIFKVIDKLKKGEKLKVLSLDKKRKLKFSKIYDFLEHKDTLYEIRHSQSTIPLKSTSYHSVFVWNKGEIIQKRVIELKKGDFLISVNSTINPLVEDFIITNEFEFGKNQYSKKIIIRKIKATKELMRLIGYFLAEGHVTNVINQVGFSFNKDEKEYINDVKALLSLITKRKISVRHPNAGSTQILIHSKEWATFFDNFCGKKKNKHLPSFAFKSSRELFLELFKGYVRGDGYKLGKYGIVVKSVSKRLITEFIWLCKLNNISCNLSYEQNKPHILPQGTYFKGSFVYMLRIPKSELENLEFHRKKNKFSPYAGDKIFPIDGLKKVYKQIKPKMFNYHRTEQMTLSKKRANLNRIRKVLDWFYKFKEFEPNSDSMRILKNYEKLFYSDISLVEIKDIIKKEDALVYDVSVEETESFFGNYYPILLHNSGSKGFHIIVPWKAFPKYVNEVKVSDMFPEFPKIIVQYILEKTKNQLIEKISDLERPNKYVKDYKAPKEVMPDLILVSPRHLFRTPYSLHEKTALASIVLKQDEIESFQLKDADPMNLSSENIRDFMPDVKEGEASELLMQALDWHKEENIEKDKPKEYTDYKPIKLSNLSDKNFPPCVLNILKGISDGKKRALFVLINLFRSIGMDKDELEKRIEDWNKKNKPSLKQGYIQSQLSWSYRKKSIMPPNCKDFYKGIGVCLPDDFCKLIKNPVNYTIRKNFISNKGDKKKKNPKQG